jgi:cyclopropane fatty-acyl-phospholipid synthase-like methyltransferase
MNTTISYYKNNAKSLSKRYESANVDRVQQLLLEVFPKNSNLLEIGCGSGRDANFMLENNYKLTAIDASKEMILEAKKIHPLLENSLHVVTIPDELKFDNNSFDGIYSIATLMHLEEKEIEKTIKKIYDMLIDQGISLFSVSIQRDDINANFKDSKGRHFTIISKDRWIEICNDIGFKTIKAVVTNDGLNRDGIVWLTCIMEK